MDIILFVLTIGLGVLISIAVHISRRLASVQRSVEQISSAAYPVFSSGEIEVMARALYGLDERASEDPDNKPLQALIERGDQIAARAEADRIVERVWRREQIQKKLAFMKQANLLASSGTRTVEELRAEWGILNPLLISMAPSLSPELRERQEREWQLVMKVKAGADTG